MEKKEFDHLMQELKENAKKYIDSDFKDNSFQELYNILKNANEEEIKDILLSSGKEERGNILSWLEIFDKINQNIETKEKTGIEKYNKKFYYEKLRDVNPRSINLIGEEHEKEVIKMINDNYEKNQKGAR